MKIILILALILMNFNSEAHQGSDKIKPLEEIKLSTKAGDVHVVMHMGGHINFRPFVIDVFPACEKNDKAVSWRDLEIRDTGSLCKVKKNSIKYNAEKNVIQVTGFDVNSNDMNRQSMTNPAHIKPRCTVAKTLEFSLEGICNN